MTLIWPSPAKLNLFLFITGRRNDGYHELQTLFQFLDYGDEITITPRNDNKIQLLTHFDGVDSEKNLIIRAAYLLQQHSQLTFCGTKNKGADIQVTKRLPMGGGIGGGSSNAATTLIALNYYWQTGLNDEKLAKLGLQLGADVPVFINGYAAFAQGVGEQLTPATPEEKWYLVAHPGIEISTVAIFTDPQLTRNTPKRSLDTLFNAPFANDCETIVRKRFPKVEELLLWLLQYAPSRLTGTGACVFAEFNTETQAREVLNHAPAWVNGFVARGANVSSLHRFRADVLALN